MVFDRYDIRNTKDNGFNLVQDNKEDISNKHDNIKAIKIPKTSFTAFRLLHASPTEISACSKSILLGGIPKSWYLQQKNTVYRKVRKKLNVKQIINFYLNSNINGSSCKIRSKLISPGETMDRIRCNNYHSKSSLVDVKEEQQEICDGTESSIYYSAEEGVLIHNDEPFLTSKVCSSNMVHHNSNIFPLELRSYSKMPYVCINEFEHISRHVPTSKYLKIFKTSDSNGFFDPYSSFIQTNKPDNKLYRETLNLVKPRSHLLTSTEFDQIKEVQTYDITSSADQFEGVKRLSKDQIRKKWKNERKDKFNYMHLFQNFTVGEIVKMEKMLVLVKSATTLIHPPLNFSDKEPMDTRVIDHWKELFVVARLSGDNYAPLYIQFYYKQSIPKFDQKKKDPYSMDFSLDKSCSVGFYNSSDKTVYIIKPDGRVGKNNETFKRQNYDYTPLKIYILQGNSWLSSGSWITLFNESLGINTSTETISLHIPAPDLNISIDVSSELQKYLKLKGKKTNNLEVYQIESGYKVSEFPFIHYLKTMVKTLLMQAGYANLVSEWENSNMLMGFAWKYYDRIEWCFEHQYDVIFMEFISRLSHVLEYRPLVHYPRHITINNIALHEPTPIEGFLIICSESYKNHGQEISRLRLFKPTYFFSLNGLLFHMKYWLARPPLPTLELMDFMDGRAEIHDVDKLEHKLNNIPEQYEHNPYDLDENNHFQWLNINTTDREFNTRDKFAVRSAIRRISQILNAYGIIDVTLLKSIDLFTETSISPSRSVLKFWNNSNNFFWKTTHSLDHTLKSIFTITMTNGSSINLMAPTPDMAKKWITGLNEIRNYWIERLRKDQEILWGSKVDNLNFLKMSQQEECCGIGGNSKWISERGSVNDQIFNVSVYSMIRPISHYGVLYQKPRKYSIFRKYFVILVPGFIVLYSCTNRLNSKSRNYCLDYKYYMTISLQGCYIYSGSVVSLDLLERNKKFNTLDPGHHLLPRIYNDGWRSIEDETSRCFVLWIGEKKHVPNYKAGLKSGKVVHYQFIEHIMRQVFPGEEWLGQNNLMGPDLVKIINSFYINSGPMVFMARSKQEKDLWITKIYAELERIKKNYKTGI